MKKQNTILSITTLTIAVAIPAFFTSCAQHPAAAYQPHRPGNHGNHGGKQWKPKPLPAPHINPNPVPQNPVFRPQPRPGVIVFDPRWQPKSAPKKPVFVPKPHSRINPRLTPKKPIVKVKPAFTPKRPILRTPQPRPTPRPLLKTNPNLAKKKVILPKKKLMIRR